MQPARRPIQEYQRVKLFYMDGKSIATWYFQSKHTDILRHVRRAICKGWDCQEDQIKIIPGKNRDVITISGTPVAVMQ